MILWTFWLLALIIVGLVAKVIWELAKIVGRWGSMSPIVIAIPLWLLEVALVWALIKP